MSDPEQSPRNPDEAWSAIVGGLGEVFATFGRRGSPSEAGVPMPPQDIHDYGERFEPGFAGWQSGDIVRTRFSGDQFWRDGNHTFAQPRTASGFSKHAEAFRLDVLPPDLVEMAQTLGYRGFDVEVRIIGDTGKPSDKGYRVEVIGIHDMEQLYDGDISRVSPGQQVLVQGE